MTDEANKAADEMVAMNQEMGFYDKPRRRFCLRDHTKDDCSKGHLMNDAYDWDELIAAASDAHDLLVDWVEPMADMRCFGKDDAELIDRLRKALELVK